MKKNAKPAALAILVLAAVAALSVGITLAVVNARMPAACTCSGPGRKRRLPGMRRPRSRQSRPIRIPSPFPASIS